MRQAKPKRYVQQQGKNTQSKLDKNECNYKMNSATLLTRKI